MGDWNTLHLFDDKIFYERVVPDLRGPATLLHKYFIRLLTVSPLTDSEREKHIADVVKLCKEFDSTFKRHKTLFNSEAKKKDVQEKYASFVQKKNQDEKRFVDENSEAIEALNALLPLIVFSECALFNPHFRLGKYLLTRNIQYKIKNSFAEECLETLRMADIGSLYARLGSGIKNWLTHEETNLLLYDLDNIEPSDIGTEDFVDELKAFVRFAVQEGLGLLTVVNVDERLIKNAAQGLTLKTPFNHAGMQNVIWA